LDLIGSDWIGSENGPMSNSASPVLSAADMIFAVLRSTHNTFGNRNFSLAFLSALLSVISCSAFSVLPLYVRTRNNGNGVVSVRIQVIA